MKTIFLLIALFGGFFGLFMTLAWIFEARSSKQVKAVPPVGSQDLAGLPLDAQVRMFGQLNFSPNGPLVSPLSNTQCLWYQLSVTHYEEWQEEVTDQSGDTRWETRQRSQLLSGQTSNQPFLIGDGAGWVYLMPGEMDISGANLAAQQTADNPGAYQTLGGILTQHGINLPGAVQTALGGLDAVGQITGGGRRSWIETNEYVLQPEQTAVVVGQVGQDPTNGARYLYAARGQQASLQSASSMQDFEEGLQDSINSRKKWALRLLGAAAVGGAGYFILGALHH